MPHPYPWFGLRVRSKHEKVASTILRGKGYEEFPALYVSRRRWTDRDKTIEVPLFPGYVFCRFDINQRLPVLTTPGVVSVVSYGREPVPIDDDEILSIQQVISSGAPAKPWPQLQTGERVRVEYGAMEGVEGTVLREKGEWKLIVSITMLQRSVSVEIDRDMVRPVYTFRAAV